MSSTSPEADTAGVAPEPKPLLGPDQRRALLRLARASIAHGLSDGRPLPVDPETQDEALRAERAAFVTLHEAGRLRGCIGHLEAVAPLAVDVADNAYAAAFRDPRFPPLRADELDLIHIEISVLTPTEPIAFDGEQGLVEALEPGRDGVILAEGSHRGTFLPGVWEQLPDRHDFLRHLKQKAGLRSDHWSEHIRAWRYRSESFGE